MAESYRVLAKRELALPIAICEGSPLTVAATANLVIAQAIDSLPFATLKQPIKRNGTRVGKNKSTPRQRIACDRLPFIP